MVVLRDFLLAPGGGFLTRKILSNDKFSCELRVFAALANGIRGYTNKVHLRGLRENKVF